MWAVCGHIAGAGQLLATFSLLLFFMLFSLSVLGRRWARSVLQARMQCPAAMLARSSSVSHSLQPCRVVSRSQQLEPWYLTLNPAGNVPTLVRTVDDKEHAVVETLDILRYVDANLKVWRDVPMAEPCRTHRTV